MAVTIRSYNNEPGYSADCKSVCEFLIRINRDKVITPHFLWARWVWQFGPYMSVEHLSHIGVVQDDDKIVGLVTYEGDIGEAYFCLDDEYAYLKPRLVEYALNNLSADGKVRISVPDGDLGYQQAARALGFCATQEKTSVARIDADCADYALPQGFRIISFADEEFDADKYYDAIWRGFDNTRERNESELKSMRSREGFNAPHIDLDLRVMVVAPNGDYAAHCGMWYIPGTECAYVEPVFTVPEYRCMGLGKAAVLEGVKRCVAMGAKYAVVLSEQQFYYSIGFYPVQNETWWQNTKPVRR